MLRIASQSSQKMRKSYLYIGYITENEKNFICFSFFYKNNEQACDMSISHESKTALLTGPFYTNFIKEKFPKQAQKITRALKLFFTKNNLSWASNKQGK